MDINDWQFTFTNFIGNDSPFVSTEETSYSFHEVYNMVETKITHKDFPYNERVIVKAEHSLDFIVTILALWKYKNTVFPVNPNISDDELEYINKQCGIKDNKYNEDEALIMFTSGSTGKPKGVVHTYKSLFASANYTQQYTNNNITKWFASLPFYHIGGFMIIVRAFLAGSELLLPKDTKYSSIEQLMHMNYEAVSLVSTHLIRLLENNIKPPEALKYVFLGGGPINNELALKAIKMGYPVNIVYGSTETCSMIAALQPNDISNELGKVGKPFPGVEISTNKENEIIISADSVAKGYLIDGDIQSFNGKYNSYDNGKLNKNNCLVLTGRSGKLVISGGKNIDTALVKSKIMEITGVTNAVVTGIPDPEWGEKLVAFVETSQFTEDEIREKLKAKMETYQLPKIIKTFEQLPYNEMGKITETTLLNLLS